MKCFRLIGIGISLVTTISLRAISPGVVCQPSEFEFVGKFESRANASSPWNFVGGGSVIGHKWVITARHVSGNNATGNVRFKLDNGSYVYPVKVWLMSEYLQWSGYDYGSSGSWANADLDWDITIVQFPAASFSGPFVELHSGGNELGMPMTAVGYGLTATQPNPASPQWIPLEGSGGIKRFGTNIISQLIMRFEPQRPDALLWDWDGYANWPPPAGEDPTPMLFDFFSDGGPTATECAVWNGDSGGPTLIQTSGVWRIAGIHFSKASDAPWGYGFNSRSIDRRVCERVYDYAQQLMTFY